MEWNMIKVYRSICACILVALLFYVIDHMLPLKHSEETVLRTYTKVTYGKNSRYINYHIVTAAADIRTGDIALANLIDSGKRVQVSWLGLSHHPAEVMVQGDETTYVISHGSLRSFMLAIFIIALLASGIPFFIPNEADIRSITTASVVFTVMLFSIGYDLF